MKRQLVGLSAALVVAVASSWAATTQPGTAITAKRAQLQGVAAAKAARQEQRVGRMIVKLRNPSASELAQPMSASRVQALAATAGVGMKSVRAMSGGASLLALDTAVPLSEAKTIAARLALNPAVEYAEPDVMLKKFATPNEVRFGEWQWNLFAPTSTYAGVAPGTVLSPPTPTTGGANLPLAWDVTVGASNAIVAIIDTGITNHTDLNGQPPGDIYMPAGRFLPGYDFISENVGAPTLPTNFVANDGGGRDADPSDPGDWVTTAEESMFSGQCDDGQTGPQNSSWHGTHMAGVAAATANNMTGIAGIGWNIRILPVRALGKCGGALSDIAEAIIYAAGLPVPGIPTNPTPARIINLSLGSPPSPTCGPTMQNAVNSAVAAGSVLVAATGNDGDIQLSSPANCSGVVAVTAHTINGENADYANVGSPMGMGPQPTVSAPGGGSPFVLGAGGPTDNPNFFGYYIWSTILFGNTSPTSTDSQTPPRSGPAYSGFTGTSAATPQVAGVAALIKSMIPGATPTQIVNFIVANVRPHPAGGACATGGALAGQCGPGLLDANAAVRAAVPFAPPVIIAQPQSTSVFEGQTATFSTEVAGAGGISYQWRRNGIPIPGAIFPSYTTQPLTIAADNGATFSVVATNGIGIATSTAATLTVTAPPPPPPPPPAGSPPPSGGGGGGGALPSWQVILMLALGLATSVRRRVGS